MSRSLKYDHYKVLGVPRNASDSAIKRAYREKVKFCHPDLNGSPRAAEAFHVVHRAYQVLINEGSRARYDARLGHYRPVTKVPFDTSRYRRRYDIQKKRKQDAAAVPGLLYYGSHAVGLLFGVAVITRSVIGVTFEEWPVYMMLFSAPGFAILPDSIAGLRELLPA